MYLKKLSWNNDAKNDLMQIYNYINENSNYYSLKTINNILNLIDSLKYSPYMGRKVPEYNENDKRELIYKSYRIIYKIESNKIVIHRIWHCSRQLTPKLIS